MLEHVNELPAPLEPGSPYRVCLVCLGNICRSPMAEVVLRARIGEADLDAEVLVDSAGTGDWHLGERMNQGARDALARRGYDGAVHRARQFDRSWLASRDLVLAMDGKNLAALRKMGGTADRVMLFGEAGGLVGEGRAGVPDPYGGGPEEFDHVLDLLETAAPVLVGRLERALAR